MIVSFEMTGLTRIHRAALRAGLRAEPRVALWTTLQIELHSDARRTNNRYCATAPLDRQTYTAGYIHMEIEAPRPWCAGSNDPDLRCRGSDEVC